MQLCNGHDIHYNAAIVNVEQKDSQKTSHI